jgi:hypothetical protein
MPSPLGSLEPVDLRSIWPDEARDFTPWLAQEESLRRLSDALNLELELDRVEVAVGPYFADIVATDASSNIKVVIENQLEHHGKLRFMKGHNRNFTICHKSHVTSNS